jgi:hypothetical protein
MPGIQIVCRRVARCGLLKSIHIGGRKFLCDFIQFPPHLGVRCHFRQSRGERRLHLPCGMAQTMRQSFNEPKPLVVGKSRDGLFELRQRD